MATLKLPPKTGLSISINNNESATERFKTIGSSIIPSIDRGEIFYQDGSRIAAAQLESGAPLAGWLQTYPTRNGQFQYSSVNVPKPPASGASLTLRPIRQHTVTLTDARVLAVMNEVENYSTIGYPLGNGSVIAQNAKERTALVCLDRANGAKLWERKPDSIPGNTGNAKSIQFSGSPLVVGDRVYVAMHGTSAGKSHDCSVICLDLITGNILWNSYIASNQTMVSENTGYNAPEVDCFNSNLSHDSGRIFVCTDIGAIASIDAFSGATAWLRLYESAPGSTPPINQTTMNNRSNTALDNLPRPWMFGSPIVSQGKLFVLPVDGRQVLILDAATGDVSNSFPSSFQYSSRAESMVNMKTIIGVKGNLLAMASEKNIILMDWTKAALFRNSNSRLDSDSILYPYTSPDSIAAGRF